MFPFCMSWSQFLLVRSSNYNSGYIPPAVNVSTNNNPPITSIPHNANNPSMVSVPLNNVNNSNPNIAYNPNIPNLPYLNMAYNPNQAVLILHMLTWDGNNVLCSLKE